MTLEEYILKRKKEDGINEYDLEKRSENLRICVNYLFEYFDHYLDTRPGDEKTILHEKKIDRYRSMLKDYDSEVREWLIFLYASHGKYMHKQITENYLRGNYFLLYDSEAEFRALSYEIYPKASKKFKFLEGQSEMLYTFIKESHRIRSLFAPYDKKYYISDSIDEWIDLTYQKHGVNIYKFCEEWAEYFFSYPDLWPRGHKHKREGIKGLSTSDPIYWCYDYKQKNNLFGLDALYRNMPKKSFIRGKKQEFEAVLLYCWLHGIDGDDEYWHIYAETVL